MLGKFIVFEGIDCCGKDTQIDLLKQFISRNNLDKKFVFTREPGSPLFLLNQDIRKILLNSKDEIDQKTESLLFAADRAYHVKKIKEILSKGINVICNRYFYSTIAYQKDNQDKHFFDLIEYSIDSLIPDIYFYLSINKEELVNRKQNKLNLDRIEQKTMDYFFEVLDNYNNMFYILALNRRSHLAPQNIYQLDGSKDRFIIANEINKILKEKEIL